MIRKPERICTHLKHILQDFKRHQESDCECYITIKREYMTDCLEEIIAPINEKNRAFKFSKRRVMKFFSIIERTTKIFFKDSMNNIRNSGTKYLQEFVLCRNNLKNALQEADTQIKKLGKPSYTPYFQRFNRLNNTFNVWNRACTEFKTFIIDYLEKLHIR